MAAGKLFDMIYYTITNGKIVRQLQNKTDTSVERINKNGRLVHEEFYSYLDGVLIDIAIKEHEEYGKFWSVTLKDEEGAVQNLQFSYSSGYSMGFLKALPNIDLLQKIKIIPHAKKENDKTKTTIFINQFDKAAKWHFTKENPNGLPPLKKIKIKGKETWDDTEAMEFLEKMVFEKIQAQLSTENKVPAKVNTGDDLPF